jgi:hypothetical protein
MRYMDHLTSEDLGLLSKVRWPRLDRAEAVQRMQSEPEVIEGLLFTTEVFEHIFTAQPGVEPFLRASPFLVFASAVHRTALDVKDAVFVSEWLGPRQRVAVFDVSALRAFLGSSARRLFLAELLASYTHVASGSYLVQTRRGWRRHRYSELDPIRLASLLETVTEPERVGVYRRLGDLSLFLSGVFPDHTASQTFSPLHEARLRRAAGLAGAAEPSGGSPGSPISLAGAVALMEQLGRRWYRLACETAPVRTADVEVVGEVAEGFDHARRVLNLVTERYLFPFRGRWLPFPGK